MTQIADRVPIEPFFKRSLTIGQGGMGQFTNAVILLEDMERKNRLLQGRLTAAISYGRPGRLKHTAEKQLYLALKFDRDGNFQNSEVSQTEFSIEDHPSVQTDKPVNKKTGRKNLVRS